MNRKHSYRTLGKRRFASDVLVALTDPAMFENPHPTHRKYVEHVVEVANGLTSKSNLYQFTPHTHKIRAAIKAKFRNTESQTTLAL